MSTKNPLAYLGVKAKNPPNLIQAEKSPTTADIHYEIGDLWVNTLTTQSYQLLGKPAGSATWGLTTPGASDVDSINGLAPVLGDIIIAGGTNLTATNAGNTVTLDIDDAIDLATSVTSPLYTATAVDVAITAPAGQDVVVQLGDAAGANKLSILDSTAGEVFAVSSLGAIGTLLGATITGAVTQTAGAVNIGMDNLGSAINIGGGNVIKALAIGGGAGAHTLALGSAAAGAITVDTAAGVSIDSATASNFTVTGAADLTLASAGGSVNVTGSQAAVDAVYIAATNAAGGIDVNCGTGGITVDTTGAFSLDGAALSNISVGGAGIDLNLESALGRVVVNGEEAAADAVRILSAAGGLDANVALQMNLDSSQAAATAVRVVASNVAGGIDIDCGTGGCTLDSTGVLSLDSAGATNLTATGAFDVTVSSTLGSCILSAGEGAADAIQITASDAAAGGIALTSGIGGIAATASGAAAPITLDAVGVLELNSSGAAISIGSDANNFAVNLATAGTRTVTVGSVTAGSSLALRSGTGKIAVTGTVKEIDAEFLYASGDDIVFQSNPLCQASVTHAVPTGLTGEVDLLHFQEGVLMEQFILGAGQTLLAPAMDANGLLASLDLTVGEGVEYNFGAARLNSRHAFTIGTSPAFFMEVAMRINDMDGADPYMIGFRKVAANNATWESYTDYACIGMVAATSPTNIVIVDELNAGGTVQTNTTDLWGGDAATKTLKVLVSAAGVVTYTINGAAPTVTHAFTFDAADVVVPYIRLEHSASPTEVNLISMKIGYQA